MAQRTDPPIPKVLVWTGWLSILLVIGGAVDFIIEPTGSVPCLIGLGEFFAGFYGFAATIDLGVRHRPKSRSGEVSVGLRH